jgi:hypothetical protein
MLVVFGVLGFLLLFLGYFMLAVLNYLDKVGYAEGEEQEHARADQTLRLSLLIRTFFSVTS